LQCRADGGRAQGRGRDAIELAQEGADRGALGGGDDDVGHGGASGRMSPDYRHTAAATPPAWRPATGRRDCGIEPPCKRAGARPLPGRAEWASAAIIPWAASAVPC